MLFSFEPVTHVMALLPAFAFVVFWRANVGELARVRISEQGNRILSK